MSKKAGLNSVIFSVANAILWSLILLDRIAKEAHLSGGVILAIIAAVLWWGNVIVWMIRYKKASTE